MKRVKAKAKTKSKRTIKTKTPTELATSRRSRSRRLKALFNITLAEYDRVLAYQGGVCAISGLATSKALVIDHDHRSGRVRGCLNWNVNRSLAAFRDNPEWLRRAADYLEHPPVSAALGEDVYGVMGSVTRKASNRRYGPFGTKTPQPRKEVIVAG